MLNVNRKRHLVDRLPKWSLWGSLASVLWLATTGPQALSEELNWWRYQLADSQIADKPIEYRPPMRGEPQSRVGGATRGMTIEESGDSSLSAEALAPPHTGLTISEQPTLYWYLSSSSFARIEVAREVEGAYRTVLQVDYPEALRPGIHAFSFADYNMLLELETDYRWSLTLQSSSYGDDGGEPASATIRRVTPPPSLASQLSQGGDVPSYYTLAEYGIWYDALHDLAEAMAEAPENGQLRERWAELLHQADLSEAAAFEPSQP